MRSLIASLAGLLAALLPGAAARAQSVPTPATVQPWMQPNLTVGDLHRLEMDRLRNQADQNQALAQSQALQTQMTLQSLQAQRQPPLATPAPVYAPTLEEAQRQRQATEASAAAAAQATSQIDSWLDRGPR
jgi:hypothetical protein